MAAAQSSGRSPPRALKRIQKGYQGVVVVGRKPDFESCIIEIDQVVIFYRRAGVEVRRPRYEIAQDRRLEFADISDVTGNRRPAGVGGEYVG